MARLTNPPCYKDGIDCDRRCVGCRGTCEEWKSWVVVHAREVEERRQKQLAERDVTDFVMLQPIRIRANMLEKSTAKKRGIIP